MTRTLAVLIGGLLIADSSFAQGGIGGGMRAPPEVFIPDVDRESFIWQTPSKWYRYSRSLSIVGGAITFEQSIFAIRLPEATNADPLTHPAEASVCDHSS